MAKPGAWIWVMGVVLTRRVALWDTGSVHLRAPIVTCVRTKQM